MKKKKLKPHPRKIAACVWWEDKMTFFCREKRIRFYSQHYDRIRVYFYLFEYRRNMSSGQKSFNTLMRCHKVLCCCAQNILIRTIPQRSVSNRFYKIIIWWKILVWTIYHKRHNNVIRHIIMESFRIINFTIRNLFEHNNMHNICILIYQINNNNRKQVYSNINNVTK